MKNTEEVPQQRTNSKRVVLFPTPFQGHINPMLQLANILHSHGFSITIIHTFFNSPNPQHHPNFTFLPIQDGLTETEASPVSQDVIGLVDVLNTKCVKPFTDCLSKLLLDQGKEESSACLIVDALWHFTRGVADEAGIPRIVLRTGGVCSFAVYSAFPLLRDKGYFLIQGSEADKPVKELPPLRVKDLPRSNHQTRDPEALFQLVSRLMNGTKASSGVIWNSFSELDQERLSKISQELSIPMFPIGPFHKYFPGSSSSLLSQDHTCISWLEKQAKNSVLYVSFGSIATLDREEFLEVAWGLADSNQPFLWVVRPGLVRGTEWLEALPDRFLESLGGRGYIVKWAPQLEVLSHPATGGFWTHNGWNSTLESISEGLPMICTPNYGDQMVNARYVAEVWRVGINLEGKLERREIKEVIKRVMVEAEGQEIRERIMMLKEKADACLRPGGSSYKSLENLISFMSSV